MLESKRNEVKIQEIDLGLPRETRDDPHVSTIIIDDKGTLWAGAISGLYRRTSDGCAQRFTKSNGLPDNYVQSAWLDRGGRLWFGTRKGGFFSVLTALGGLKLEQRFAQQDGLPGRDVRTIFRSFDDKLWIGTEGGLSEMLPATKDGQSRFLNYTTAHGLSENQTYKLGEDGSGNLWLGTFQGGVARIARPGFITYDATDRFYPNSTNNIFETPSGELGVYSENINSGSENPATFHLFDSHRFLAFPQKLPPQIHEFSNRGRRFVLWDRLGAIWLMTLHGLLRVPKVASTAQVTNVPAKTIDAKLINVALCYEDVRGDLWMEAYGVPAAGPFGLVRWERTTGRFHHYADTPGLPSFKSNRPNAFIEDGAGNVWIGFESNVGLVRYRNGRFEPFPPAAGALIGNINTMFLDHAKRLWVPTSLGGLIRIDDPTAERPHFTFYTRATGLSSNEIWCVTEDRFQRIYLGTGRALDRLDPTTGQIKHFTQADGLARGIITTAHCDHQGRLWFTTNQGLSRLDPLPDREAAAPPILIGGLRVAGLAQSLSVLGETAIRPLTLRAGQDNVSVDFLSLNFGSGEQLQYQYKLDGAGVEWSRPTEERTVNFASLAPGSYRLLVRAVSANGLTSPIPATVSFTIEFPLWQRWWFLLLALLGGALLALAFYRVRLKRVIELERVRMRIATDLHDDIGSSLTQIVILSEVSRQRLANAGKANENGLADTLAQIANTSRDLVDSMSDIVWAINPKRDRLSDLTQRMREFVGEVFTAREIEFRFHGVADGHDIKLDADVRRQLYLICKEAVNNAARHAHCTEAEVTFAINDQQLELMVQDNGQGFDSNGSHRGNGLDSMRQRARALGGEIEITSPPQQGTTVRLSLPLITRHQARRKKYLPV